MASINSLGLLLFFFIYGNDDYIIYKSDKEKLLCIHKKNSCQSITFYKGKQWTCNIVLANIDNNHLLNINKKNFKDLSHQSNVLNNIAWLYGNYENSANLPTGAFGLLSNLPKTIYLC